MWSGIWPPSNPAMLTPERDFAPFWPRPAVLPRPEPMPRPTRTRDCRAPLLSRISLSFMSLALAFASVAQGRSPGLILALDAHQVLHLADLAGDLRGLLHFHAPVQLVEAEADQRRPLRLVAADRRSGLGDLDLRHHSYSAIASAWASASALVAPPRPSRSATFFPRRCDTARGLA